MKLSVVALGLAVAVVLGCSDHHDSPAKKSESLVEALTRGVTFKNGKRREGDIEKVSAEAATVSLASSEDEIELLPGRSKIMKLEVTADADTEVTASLMQFEDASSHTEVPSGDDAQSSDAGGDGGQSLRIENAFDVADDICAHLCNQLFETTLTAAVQLKGGKVSTHISVAITLDCRDDGDESLCDEQNAGGKPGRDGGSNGKDGGSGSSDRDAGARDAGGRDGGSSMSSHDGGGKPGNDGGEQGDAMVPSGEAAPVVAALTPTSATAGTAFTLTIDGIDFRSSAVAWVDGMAMPTTVLGEMSVEAHVPAEVTAVAGSLAVYVENVAGDPSTRSNTLYVSVAPPAGAPVVYDYSPDNGVAGDKVLIIASNLAGQTLTIEGPDGVEIAPGTLGTISWPGAGAPDTVEITLPDGLQSGPITVSTPLGSYKGKVFSVGYNLSRAAGTTLTSSTQYNTSNWSTASGGDNLLATSFFTAHGDCATLTSCTTKPWYQVTFAEPQTVGRIAMRGNREYASGYDYIRGKFELLDPDGNVLWENSYDLPEPDRDLDITISPIDNALSLRFSSLTDESDEPGFSELEVFAP